MEEEIDEDTALAEEPEMLRQEVSWKSVIGFVYNSNPFYLISAAIVLYAQTVLFRTSDITLVTAIPVGLIAAYTLLLAGTALFVVKWGQVWEDARSILLIVLVLLLVLSVSTDSDMLDSFRAGIGWGGGGLLFSAALLEALRRMLKIRVGWRFLSPAYAMLTLFFLYPVLCSQLVVRNPDHRTPAVIGILLFPAIAAALLLCFMPCLKREAMPESGTPWKFPFFPWLVPVVLGVGAMFRTYLLTISFHPARGVGGFASLQSGFMLWMWAPLLLAGLVLYSEYLLRNERDCRGLPFLPLIFWLCMLPTQYDNWAQREFCQVLGVAPWHIGLYAALAYSLYGWIRRISGCRIAVICILALFALLEYPVAGYWSGGLALAILLWGVLRRASTLGWCAVVIFGMALTIRLLNPENILSVGMLTLILLLLVTTIRDDKTAQVLRTIFFCTAIALTFTLPGRAGRNVLFVWMAVATDAGVVIATFFRPTPAAKFCRYFLLLLWSVAGFVWFYRTGMRMRSEFKILFWAGLFFVIALGVSLHKGLSKRGRNAE